MLDNEVKELKVLSSEHENTVFKIELNGTEFTDRKEATKAFETAALYNIDRKINETRNDLAGLNLDYEET